MRTRKLAKATLLALLIACLSACQPNEKKEVSQTVTNAVETMEFVYDQENLTYDLVWADEFDYEGLLDDKKWGYDVGGGGWGNHELQYYTKERNATVADGFLTIEARKESYEGKDYTSARLITKNKGDWKYAKIEVCAKLPKGVGTWPAIWMLPTGNVYGGWPNSGEIDIMEHVGYEQDSIHASVHTKAYNHKIGTQKSGNVQIEGVSEEFHVYSLEWLPDHLEIAVDGEVYFTFDPKQYTKTPGYKEWPFDQNMHLLLNIAIGGSWGGAKGVDDSVYPQQMVVDYVRVYQSPEILKITGQSQEDQIDNVPTS